MSTKEINFLDKTIYIKNNDLLARLYRKPTDRQSYLHNYSYHPNATKRGMPYSQALRMKRICSEMSELTMNLNNLKSTLKSRGYNEHTIQSQFDKFVAFRKNKSLRNIIGKTTIQNNKVVRRNHSGKGQCQPCYSRPGNQCCKQLQDTTSFKSKTFNIYHYTKCKSEIIIYLLECRKCKLQYVGKSETQFSLRLNNQRCKVHIKEHYSN